MPENADTNSSSNDEAALQAELQSRSEEPLLPIEKKLIAGSLLLGLVLLGFLLWLSATYFPVTLSARG